MFDAQAYEEAAYVAGEQFDRLYRPVFEAFASIASLELSESEVDHFSIAHQPEPEDGRDPEFRFLTHGTEMSELVFQFGTYLKIREDDGTWNFDVIRRHVSASVLPLLGCFRISVFVFEDRGGSGDLVRYARSFLMKPVSLYEGEWHVDPLLAHLWSLAITMRPEDLISQHFDAGWSTEVQLIPG